MVICEKADTCKLTDCPHGQPHKPMDIEVGWSCTDPADTCFGCDHEVRCVDTELSAAEKLARQFHDTYERLAPDYGYETREDTKLFDVASPNGKLMIAVCQEILESPCFTTGGHES